MDGWMDVCMYVCVYVCMYHFMGGFGKWAPTTWNQGTVQACRGLQTSTQSHASATSAVRACQQTMKNVLAQQQPGEKNRSTYTKSSRGPTRWGPASSCAPAQRSGAPGRRGRRSSSSSPCSTHTCVRTGIPLLRARSTGNRGISVWRLGREEFTTWRPDTVRACQGLQQREGQRAREDERERKEGQ